MLRSKYVPSIMHPFHALFGFGKDRFTHIFQGYITDIENQGTFVLNKVMKNFVHAYLVL